MQVLRLNEVLTRVVAWHNRHPLARRIQASQVHSIGEVLLPFASAQALPGNPTPQAAPAPVAPAMPRSGGSLADVVSARAAARPAAAPALPGLEVHSVSPDETDPPAAVTDLDPVADLDPFAPEPAPAAAGEIADTASAPDAATDSAVDADAVATVSPTAPADDTPDTEPSAGPDDALAFSAATADEGVYAPAPVAEAPSTPDIDLSPPPAPAPPLVAAALPPRAPEAPVGWLHHLWARLTGRRPGWPRLEAAFSRDFIWPLTPRQVARWAQHHGQPQTLAPADWPRRRVDIDAARLGLLRQAGLPHTVHLHLLTAAIGVGDRRIRVLMDEQGQIIGPRAYSRPRSATAAGLLLAGVLGAGWQWGGLGAAGDADAPAQLAQAAAAAAAASAATAASAVASAASAASAPVEAHPPVASLAASAPSAAEAASAAQSAHAHPAQADAAPPATHQADPSTTTAGSPPSGPPTMVDNTANTAPLGRIRPTLSDDDKRTARQQAAQLRENPGSAAVATGTTATATTPAPVYAVVSRPTRQRETAASNLALMRSTGARLSAPAPDHGELMQSQGEWRAAWWPFASQADAERARVMLAGRGLKAEVVEF